MSTHPTASHSDRREFRVPATSFAAYPARLAGNREAASRSLRATVAWVRFVIFYFRPGGWSRDGRHRYLDAPIWFTWLGRLGFGLLFLGFGGLLLQLAEGAVGTVVHARETGFIAGDQGQTIGLLG